MATVTSKKCPWCGKAPEEYEVSEASKKAYEAGAFIQNALPELNADQRERMLTGICIPCWDSM